MHIRPAMRSGFLSASYAIAILMPVPRGIPQNIDRPLRSVESERVRVVFSSDSTIPTQASVLASMVAAQLPFPGIPPASPAERVTFSLVPELQLGEVAHAFPAEMTIVLPLADAFEWPPERLRGVIRHELAHLRLYGYLRGQRIPTWFSEGYAEWARGGLDCDAEFRLRASLITDPTDAAIRFARPGGHRATRPDYDLFTTMLEYLATSFGLDRLLPAIRDNGFERGLREATGLSLAQLEDRWRVHLNDRYGWLTDEFTCARAQIEEPASDAAPP